MGAFVVDLEMLQELTDRMCGFEGNLSQCLDEVDSQVRRLHAGWSGAAAAEHRRAHEQWLGGARQMHLAVTALRRLGATAHGNYLAAVAANRSMWG